MKYGQLLACFKVAETTHSLCIVRELAEIEAMDDQPLHNELDCPLLTMTNELHVVQTASVSTAVSIMHECNASCTLVHSPDVLAREREALTITRLTHKHDYTNTMFCLNVYAMH